MTTHPRPEQLAWLSRLRAALDQLPDNLPDGTMDDIADCVLSLESLIALSGPEPPPFYILHMTERE